MRDVVTPIIEAVADEKNTSPVELAPSLQEAVDVDALAQLLNSGDTRVSFVYDHYRVTASSDGDIEVTPAQSPN